MKAVTRELAEAEVNSWLDYKRVSENRRIVQKAQIESLVGAIMEGTLILNENKTFTHELLFPIGGDTKITKLEYKPRVDIGTIHRSLEGVKSDDADGRILAYVAALASITKTISKQIDTEDYGVAQSIAIFFL